MFTSRLRSPFTLALCACGLCLADTKTEAQTVFTDEHVDIGLVEEGAFGLHWHDEDSDIEYEPDEAIAAVNTAYTAVHNTKTYFLLPSSQLPATPYIGIAAEDGFDDDPLAFDSWNTGDSRLPGPAATGQYVRLNLLSVTASNPLAEFVMWDSLADWMDSSDGIQTGADGDVLYVTYGGHNHYNFGFSELGTYDIEFSVTGTVDGQLVTSDAATFTFVVPEPTSAALLAGLSAVGLLRRRSRS